nr:MAG TPA: hypothetical protein [Caudoviricetes sp.]
MSEPSKTGQIWRECGRSSRRYVPLLSSDGLPNA